MNIKDLVKGTQVKFLYYRNQELWYEIEGKDFRFAVPVSDTGEATFLPTDKALIFMRYIRKAIENSKSEQQ